MQRVLIHPPFADPTQPYPSLPVLKGYLRARGLDARVVDLNVEAVHWLLHPERVDDVARRLGLRFLKLNHASSLDFHEQREYRALVEARGRVEAILGADPAPLEVFRRRELFFDPACYSRAVRRVEDFFAALSALHYPYTYSFNQAAPEVLPWSVSLLDRYWEERQSPLDAFYTGLLEGACDWTEPGAVRSHLALENVDLIGISVVFPSQLAEACYLCRRVREASPGVFLLLGGPLVHQIVHRVNDPILEWLLSLVDGIGLSEGEETLENLFPLLTEWRTQEGVGNHGEGLRQIPNFLFIDKKTGEVHEGPRQCIDLVEAPAPDFSDLDLDRYLAPSRTLLYAPARGCYWNRCSFCHYGLAEKTAAPYRETPPERVAAHLSKLSRKHGVRHFYMSCDVLSPSYALKLAEALLARKLRIRWSTDLKVEAFFTGERCRILQRSGLRSVAFGMESGSDPVLQLMGKGFDRATATRVNRAFHEAGVATQWMTFTDHPGESVEQALETVRWLEEERNFISLFVVGEFGLEPGSDIACNPEHYGVTCIYHADGDDFLQHALWSDRDGERVPADRERLDRAVRRAAAPYALRPYPWAGAVSTHHTLLHFVQFGAGVFRVHFQRAGAEMKGAPATPPPSHIAGLRERPRFSVAAIARRESEFFERYLPEALGKETRTAGESPSPPPAPLSLEHFLAAAREVPLLRAGKGR